MRRVPLGFGRWRGDGAARAVALLAVLSAASPALFTPAPLAAQWAAGPVSGAMGGVGAVWARGVDAVDLNPANLAFGRGWSVSLLDAGGAGLVTGATLGDLREIATAAGDGDRAVIQRLPADGFRIATMTDGFFLSRGARAADVPSPGASIPSLGVSWGSFGVRVRSRVLAEAAMSREVADLAVSGFNPERIREYAVRETGFRVASYTETTVAYATSLGGVLGAGVGVRWVQGHRLAQARFFEPEIDLDNETMRLSGVSVEAPGGRGWGVDVGLTLDVGGGVMVSLSGQNVVQRMAWDDALRSHEASFTDDDFDNADLGELLDRFVDSPLDPEGVSLPVFEAARGLFTQAYFPAVYRAGVGWEGGAGTRVEVNGAVVAPRGRQAPPWEQRVAAGVEQRLGFLALRAGYARARDGVAALSGGLGVRAGPLRLDLAAGRLSGSRDGIPYDGLQGSLGLSVAGGGR